MYLNDAGIGLSKTRLGHGTELVRAAIEGTTAGNSLISVVAFHTKAIPVVVDTSDYAIVSNILKGLPLDRAFTPGKTDLYRSLISASTSLARLIGRTEMPDSCS